MGYVSVVLVDVSVVLVVLVDVSVVQVGDVVRVGDGWA